ncbi:MAG: DUF4159 domain-containing protein [Rhodospirillales bacterium]
MWSLGPIGFFAPWALLGLAALPLVWWLVRFLPPSPRHVRFPASRFLFNADRDQPQQRSSIWWILLMRLVAVAAVIVAAAEPVAQPEAALESSGPVVIVIDDGWSAAPGWSTRRDIARSLIARAEREDRPVMLLSTTPGEAGRFDPPAFTSIADARRKVDAMRPKPWPSEPAKALAPLFDSDSSVSKAGRIFWLSDGIDPDGANGHAGALVERLMRIGPVTYYRPGKGNGAILLRAEEGSSLALSARLTRSSEAEAFVHSVIAYDENGIALGRAPAEFAPGQVSTIATFDLPLEIRNRVTWLAVEGHVAVGAVALLDDRWRRRTVGLVGAGGTGDDQPLLSGQHYVAKALALGHEVVDGSLDELIDSGAPVIAVVDPGTVTPDIADRLRGWIEDGGVLLVFAGPRFADAAVATGAGDAAGWSSLLPVKLRQGDRAIGGAMSWLQPATVAGFGSDSPFLGLQVPGDIRVNRQVLAEPEIGIEQRTWARLSDGTPLVTGRAIGKGWTSLVHVTANAEWSNLPFSGLFVEMMSRITALSHKTSAGSRERVLSPISILDGFGSLQPAPGSVASITSAELPHTAPSPRHPPGYYGDQQERRALNVSDNVADPVPVIGLPPAVEQRSYIADREQPIAPWLLGLVFVLMVGDLLASLWLRGYLGWRAAPSGARVSAGVLLAAVLLPSPVLADGHEPLSDLIEAASHTRIAYIETGDREIDQVTYIGLSSLGQVLWQRTAVELAEPVAIDPAVDELAFYPLIYWPVAATSEVPTNSTARRINAYLETGGMILFDAKSTDSEVADLVTRIADILDVPRLAPVPNDHVLSRSFYLLGEFPGRWAGRPVWIAPAANRVNDGVAPIIAGSHDWAAAWATDEFQEPLFAVVPGGERQRELAFRFGVNLMMYALTGNYKEDQVHIPSIMQRLGQ